MRVGVPSVVVLNRFDASVDLHVRNREWLRREDGSVVTVPGGGVSSSPSSEVDSPPRVHRVERHRPSRHAGSDRSSVVTEQQVRPWAIGRYGGGRRAGTSVATPGRRNWRDRSWSGPARISALHREQLADIAEFDRAEGWRGDGAVSMIAWVTGQCGVSTSTGSAVGAVARANLESLPCLAEGLASGALSLDLGRAVGGGGVAVERCRAAGGVDALECATGA